MNKSYARFNQDSVMEILKLAYPINRSQLIEHTNEEIDIIKNKTDHLTDDDFLYLKDTISALNAIWLIHTADTGYVQNIDITKYNNLIKEYNKLYPMQFNSYGGELTGWVVEELKPEELQNQTNFSIFLTRINK